MHRVADKADVINPILFDIHRIGAFHSGGDDNDDNEDHSEDLIKNLNSLPKF